VAVGGAAEARVGAEEGGGALVSALGINGMILSALY
jgi:hypothetical protein